MIKICFVCLGNICRSPMAEFIFQFMLEKNNLQDKIFVASKATSTEEVGNPIYFRAVEVLKSHQIPYSHQMDFRLYTAEPLCPADRVLQRTPEAVHDSFSKKYPARCTMRPLVP